MIKVKDVLQFITYLSVLISYVSVMAHVSVCHSIVFLSFLATSVYLNYFRTVAIPRWPLNMISLVVLVITAFRVTLDYLVEPVLGAMIILTAIKLLEDKAFRDYMQIYIMCMFMLMGSSLLSLSMAFAITFSVLMVLSTGALMLLAYFSHDREMTIQRDNLTRIGACSLWVCFIAVPITLVFFIILPRTSYPIFSFLAKSSSSVSGFSDRVTLGEMAEIQEDNNVIFRAEMAEVPENQLFWRGIILDRFDGVMWKSSETASRMHIKELDGPKIDQVIYLEPYGGKYLFALDKPVSLSLKGRHLSSLTAYSLERHIDERMRYGASSLLSEYIIEKIPDSHPYLQLPSGFSPRIEKLVRDLAADKSGSELIEALLRFIRAGGFTYSMRDLPVSQVPLEDFLFVHKRGNCEYYASAVAVMLRMAGIPARLVGGYRGGYYNRAGKYYMVLQRNAHVWVEAYVENRGWRRIDPTIYAFVSPSAIHEKTVALRLQLLLDTFNHFWSKFVINYDLSNQLFLLRKIRSSILNPHVVRPAFDTFMWNFLGIILGIVLSGFLFSAFLERRRKGGERTIRKFLRKMKGYGYERMSGEGLEEFVSRIEERDLRERAQHFVKEFQGIYYRDIPFTKENMKLLKRQLGRL